MKRMLIIKPSSMGDIIHGLLVAEAIKAQLPDLKIDWVVRREFAPLVDLASAIDRTYIFRRDGGVSGFFRLIAEIRQTQYDVVLDMQGLARSGILTLFAKSKRKIGRWDAREGAALAYREHTAKLPGEPVHAVNILKGFLNTLALRSEVMPAIKFAQSGVGLLPPPRSGHPRIVVFPESRRAEKNWLGYEILTRLLLTDAHEPEVIWCGHVPFEASESIESERFFNLTGKSGINQLPELLATADCVVSNDSGPMHLAASMARPLVALFGPTDPALFGPFPEDSHHQRVIRPEAGDMSLVSPEAVMTAVWEVIFYG